jgi:hypothetical protein
MVAAWPHVEDQMITVFQQLTKIPDFTSAQQIFRSIINQRTRIAVMKTMLQKSPLNQSAGPFYDEVIEEYSKLNTLRNTYAHGLWHTRNNGQVFFCEAADEIPSFGFSQREVEASELEAVIDRMSALIHRLATEMYGSALRASRPIPPEPSSHTESVDPEAPLGFAQGLPRQP